MYKIDRHRHRACLPPHLSPCLSPVYIIYFTLKPTRNRALLRRFCGAHANCVLFYRFQGREQARRSKSNRTR